MCDECLVLFAEMGASASRLALRNGVACAGELRAGPVTGPNARSPANPAAPNVRGTFCAFGEFVLVCLPFMRAARRVRRACAVWCRRRDVADAVLVLCELAAAGREIVVRVTLA